MVVAIEQHGTSEPVRLAKSIGIEIRYTHMPSEIYGVMYRQPDVIVVNAELPHALQRLVIAHKLCHFLKHPTREFGILTRSSMIEPSDVDAEATRSAIQLLADCGEFEGYNSPVEYYAQFDPELHGVTMAYIAVV